MIAPSIQTYIASLNSVDYDTNAKYFYYHQRLSFSDVNPVIGKRLENILSFKVVLNVKCVVFQLFLRLFFLFDESANL